MSEQKDPLQSTPKVQLNTETLHGPESADLIATAALEQTNQSISHAEILARKAALVARNQAYFASSYSLGNSQRPLNVNATNAFSSTAQMSAPQTPGATPRNITHRRFSDASAADFTHHQRRNSEISQKVVELRSKIQTMANAFAMSDTESNFAKRHISLG